MQRDAPTLSKRDFIEGSIGQLDLWGDHLQQMKESLARRAERKPRLWAEIQAVQREKRSLRRQLRRALLDDESKWAATEKELRRDLDRFRHSAQRVYRALH